MDSISKIDSITEEYGVDRAATGSAQPEPVVSVRGLVKRYGSHEAVAGIDLEVRPGRGVRVPRPERRGQDHDGGDPRRIPAAHRGTGLCPGAGPGHGGRRLAGPGGRGLAGVGARARPVRPGVPGHVRGVLSRAAGYRRDPRPGRSHREGGRARHQAVGRPAAPARFRPRPHRRPRAHLPGRADHWVRPVRPPRRLGGHCRAPATRQDGLPHHPLHGRGGIPGRPDHGALRRAHRGRGHAADAGRARPHDHRHQLHAPGPRANA